MRTTTRRRRTATHYFLQLQRCSKLLQVSLGLEQHFAAAWNLSLAMGPGRNDVFPLDQDMPQDTNLTYAANSIATHRVPLVQRRSAATRLVRTLPASLWPTHRHWVKAMHPQIHRSLKDFHVAFLALGLSNYGLSKRTQVLRPAAPQALLSQEYLLKDAAMVVELLVSKVPTNPTSFWAGVLRAEVDQKYGKGRHEALRNVTRYRRLACHR